MSPPNSHPLPLSVLFWRRIGRGRLHSKSVWPMVSSETILSDVVVNGLYKLFTFLSIIIWWSGQCRLRLCLCETKQCIHIDTWSLANYIKHINTNKKEGAKYLNNARTCITNKNITFGYSSLFWKLQIFTEGILFHISWRKILIKMYTHNTRDEFANVFVETWNTCGKKARGKLAFPHKYFILDTQTQEQIHGKRKTDLWWTFVIK